VNERGDGVDARPRDAVDALPRRSSDGYEKIRPIRELRPPKQPRRQSAFDWVCAGCTNVNYSGRLACNKCQRPVSAACRLVTPKGEIAQRNQDDVGLLEQQVTEQAPAFVERGPPAPAFLSDEALSLAAQNAETLETALDIASRAKGPRALESAARRLAKAHRKNDVRRDHRFLSFLRALRTRLIDEELGPAETANIAVALASLGCCSGGLDRDGRAFEGRAFASLGRRASVSIETYDSAALSSLLWAFAASKQELACLAQASERFITIESWDASSLANACWAFASLHAPLDWSCALRRARAVDARGGDLAKLIWSLATNGQDVSALAETVGDIEKWPPSAVARLAVGLCAGDHTKVLLKVAAHLRERVSEYASSELVDVAYALSKAGAIGSAIDLPLATIDASSLDCDALARLFEALGAVEPPADVVAKAVDAACAMKLWRPAALVTVAGLATDEGLLDALAQAAVGLRDRFDGAQRRQLREALGARLPPDFDKADAAVTDEPLLEPAAPPARPPPPPLITGPSLLPAFLQDKLRGDFL
jgi:hypothetical protein